MYYGLIIAAVVMFGFQFFANQDYEKKNGNKIASAMIFICGSSFVGFLIPKLEN